MLLTKVTKILIIENQVKDTRKVFDDFKKKEKSVCSHVFGYVKVYIFWKFIGYSINWDETNATNISLG